MFIGLLCILTTIIVNTSIGEVVFEKNIFSQNIFENNKLGPIYLIGTNNYRFLLSVDFKGKLYSDYEIQIITDKGKNIFTKNAYIKGETQLAHARSAIVFDYSIAETDTYFILFRLLSNKYNATINDVSLQLSNNVDSMPDVFLTIGGLVLAFGMILLWIGIRKKLAHI